MDKIKSVCGLIGLGACLLIAVSCQQGTPESNTIRVDKNLSARQLLMADYFSSLEYIPLETNAECLVEQNPRIYVLDKYIVVLNYRKCLLFERPSGKFVREIGHPGKGPGEYNKTLRGYIVNESTQSVYVAGWNGMLEYSFANEVLGSMPLLAPADVCYLSDSLWVQSLLNIEGHISNQLLIFNRERVVDSIPNRQLFTLVGNTINIINYENLFYRYNNQGYYKHLFNDTIFRIADRAVQPAWVFDLGPYQPPYSLKADPGKMIEVIKDYDQIYSVFETDPFLFFSVKYNNTDSMYLYDKNSHHVTLLAKEKQGVGFCNNMDGGLPFWPRYVNQNQEMACFYMAEDMKEVLTDEYMDSRKVRDNEAREKLKRLTSALGEEDNPIVVVARLKK